MTKKHKKQGFQFAASTCGFKRTKKTDLALIYSPLPCTYAGVFTKNQVRAACIDENKKLLSKKKKIKAIVINSGNANACTGKEGINAVKNTQLITSKLLNVLPDEVLVASTGVIGVPLDMRKMELGLNSAVCKLSSDNKNIKEAARAILTTDRFEKIVVEENNRFKLIGFAKGAGMIHPNMATMLCYFFTNLAMPQKLLQEILERVANDTFNTISVDGDMSTNDMVILLSDNTSKKKIVSKKNPLYGFFEEALYRACYKLSKEIVLDGEGANKLINIKVIGAKSVADAKEIARSVSSSTLFKCAIFGSDPNWGRAAARVGATSVKVNQDKIDIYFNNTQVLKNGNPTKFNKDRLIKEIKASTEVVVKINLKSGNKSAEAFGCDLSLNYVKFNSGYFT